MKIPRKLIFKCLIGTGLAMLSAFACLYWFACNLEQPHRKILQPDQREWLTHASSHGLLIHAYRCDHDRVPCLMVEPDHNLGPGWRGALLRKQLANRGLNLKPYGKTQGIMMLLHGRNGRKEDLLPVAERFAAAGFKCVVPDLPAHGDNPLAYNRFSTGTYEGALIETVLADARRYFSDTDSPAGIWGISMGGAYAIHAVALNPAEWKAVIIVSSFDSLQHVIDDKLASYSIPAPALVGTLLCLMPSFRSGLIAREVQPADWAAQIDAPVLMAHGDQDTFVLPQRGQQLFAALHSQDKSWINVPGANHNNILITKTPLYATMSAWLITHVR